MSVALWILAVLLVALGLVGTVLPVLPGALLVALGLGLAAWADGFVHVGGGPLLAIGALAALSYAVDLLATAFGARRFGASPRAALGAALGGLVGLFLGFVGVILGPFVGAVLAELSLRRDLGQAGRAGAGAWLGMLLGAASKVALVFAMLGVFGVAWWW